MSHAGRHRILAMIDDTHLRRAAELALRGLGRTAPNPAVGAVVVADGRIVGEGFHPRAGQPHAEVFALAAAGPDVQGATVYVTLEPCAHHGKTPPCAQALIDAGVARVVIGTRDASETARGGADMLREAGIDVVFADDPGPFDDLVSGWTTRETLGSPRVVVKLGASLDGRTSLQPGERASMTGRAGREVTMSLRDQADAVMVGAATVIADDPSLTVRDTEGARAEHQPLRVVLVRQRRPSLDSTMFVDGAGLALILAPDSTESLWIHESSHLALVDTYRVSDGLEGALRALGRRGVNDLLVEPGPTLFSALWDADLIDELVTVTAGGCAGADAPPAYLGGADKLAESLAVRFEARHAHVHDGVAVVTWNPVTR